MDTSDELFSNSDKNKYNIQNKIHQLMNYLNANESDEEP